MTKNPMQSETAYSLCKSIWIVVLTLVTNCYFLSSIGLTAIAFFTSEQVIVENVYATPVHLILALGLVGLGMYGVKKDVIDFKKRRKITSKTIIVMIVVFAYMSVYLDALQFEIDAMISTAYAYELEQINPKLEGLKFQAELFAIFSLFPYFIFFYSKELSTWLRKKDDLVSKYEREHPAIYLVP